MFIGTFGMHMVDGHPKINHERVLGRFMNFIIDKKRRGGVHCCDIYIDSTVKTVIGIWLTIMLGMFGIVVWRHFLGTLITIGILCSVFLACYFGRNFIGRGLDEVDQMTHAHRSRPRTATGKLLRTGLKWASAAFVVVICIAGVGGLGYLIYLLFQSIMALGYTFWQALGYIIVPVVLGAFPLWCILGKKLLLRTRFAEPICPVVHRGNT